MRTALWMIALSLADISSSILKVHGMWNGANDSETSFFVGIFVIFAVMDTVEFLGGKK